MIILVRNDPQSELSTTVMEMPSSSTNYDDDESSTDTKGLELLGRSAKRKAVAYILYIAAAASKRAFSSHHGILLYHHRVDRKIPYIEERRRLYQGVVVWEGARAQHDTQKSSPSSLIMLMITRDSGAPE